LRTRAEALAGLAAGADSAPEEREMTPVLLVIPGLSLLTIQRTGDMLRIACPECRVEVTGIVVPPGTVSEMAVTHEASCTILARITEAEKKCPEWAHALASLGGAK
jgi:hypothetical protein